MPESVQTRTSSEIQMYIVYPSPAELLLDGVLTYVIKFKYIRPRGLCCDWSIQNQLKHFPYNEQVGDIALTALGYSAHEECMCVPCLPASQVQYFMHKYMSSFSPGQNGENRKSFDERDTG
jgi:hypothetical protein